MPLWTVRPLVMRDLALLPCFLHKEEAFDCQVLSETGLLKTDTQVGGGKQAALLLGEVV